MADIKVNVGDKVVVYRNMPRLQHYPREVNKGFEGVVKYIGGMPAAQYGMWARIDNGYTHRYVKLTYLKHA